MPIAKRTASKDANKDVVTMEMALAQRDRFRADPQMGFEVLTNQLSLCADSRLAFSLTECAMAIGRYDVAEEAVKIAGDQFGLLHAQLHLLQGHADKALAALNGRPEKARLPHYFGLLIRANLEIGHYSAAVQAANDWACVEPHSAFPYKLLARILADQGDERAARWYSRAAVVSGGSPDVILDLAEFLIKQGKKSKARALLDLITRPSLQVQARMKELLGLIKAVA